MLERLLRRHHVGVIVFILLITSVAFCRIPGCDFVAWDDQINVYQNPYLQDHSLSDIVYFWKHSYEGLYVPLSYTAFGLLTILAFSPTNTNQYTAMSVQLNPLVFHIANLMLHLLNVFLVFTLLSRMTQKSIPSALGALLFGIHPLQVESVAWISELRGLLSAAFFLASLNLYLEYADSTAFRTKSSGRWIFTLSLLAAICSMLSKPSGSVIGIIIYALAVLCVGKSYKQATIETAPYLFAGLICVIVTSNLQASPGPEIPIWLRPFVAGDAISFYLFKFFLPLSLAIDYGRTPRWLLSQWWAYDAWIIPAAISVAVICNRKSAPHLALGWLVIVIGLLPVLGIVPFAFQQFSTTADRYCYLPMLGASIILTYGLTAQSTSKTWIFGAAAVVWMAALGALTFRQTLFWQNSKTLFTHAALINPTSAEAQNGLGLVFELQTDLIPAAQRFRRAVQLNPASISYHSNLGGVLEMLNENSDAENQFREALALSPGYEPAHRNLGILSIEDNRTQIGVNELQTALQLDPADYVAAWSLGRYYAQQKDYVSAIQVFATGVHFAPKCELLWRSLGLVLCSDGRTGDAVQPLEFALELDPTDRVARNVLDAIVGQKSVDN